MPFLKRSFKRIEDSFEIGIKPMRVSDFANRFDSIINVIHIFACGKTSLSKIKLLDTFYYGILLYRLLI